MNATLAGHVAKGLGIAAVALCLAAPAQANESFGFDLTFADGATAIGQVTVSPSNPLDFVSNYDVQTSGASGFSYEYGALSQPSAQFSDGNLYLTFNRTNYVGFLQLEFTAPINGNGTYTLDLAGSFECIGGFQSANISADTCSHGTMRSIVSTNGDPAAVVVPEPASLALLGTGLLAFGAFIRRRKTSRAA